MQTLRVSIILAIGCLLLPASGQQLTWQIEVIDAMGGGKYPAMQVDKLGNVHAGYLSEGQHELRYAFWDRHLNRWFTMKVDDHCGGFVSMVLDSQQHPHISYPTWTGQLRYAHFDGTAWKVESIPVPSKMIEYYTSITLDSKDKPAISYYEVLKKASADFALHLRVVKFNGQYWELSTVDTTPGSGKFNAMSPGRDDSMHMAYSNVKVENASLRYARWNGTSWQPRILEGAGAPLDAHSVNITVGTEDIPHITYTSAGRYIKYATIRNGKWQLEAVDVIGKESFPDRNGIALDEAGNPYISYYDANSGTLKVAHREKGKWFAETVDKDFAGFTPALQISAGEIVILYYDSGTDSLKCARRSLQQDGGAVTAPRVDRQAGL